MKSSSIYLQMHYLVFYLSLLLYISSLFLPSVYLDLNKPEACSNGWGILTTGWMAILGGVFAWFANPALYISWLLFLTRRYRGLALSASVSLLFSVSCFFLDTLPVGGNVASTSEVLNWGLGFWLWLGSQLAMLLAFVLYDVNLKMDKADAVNLK